MINSFTIAWFYVMTSVGLFMTPPIEYTPREVCNDIKVELDMAVKEGYLPYKEAARIFRNCMKSDWGS